MGLKSNEGISEAGTNSVSAGLALLDELPQLHAAVHQLLEALSDDDIDRNRLADIIDHCPSLSAKLVGLANSAYFGRASPVNGLSDAIFVIGFRTVRSLSVATALQAPFENNRCPAFKPGRFWLHAVLTAHVARELARNAASDLPLNPDEAYLAGLLHGMGLLALVHLFPDDLNQILESEDQTPGSMSVRIREKFGATHRSVGAALLKRWHLPDAFTDATAHYADPDYKGHHWTLCRLIAVAREWADRVIHQEKSDAFDPDGLTLLGITP
ncbi:MAG: HDOD domain-containing protein, partial [Thiogranum sp.]